MNDVEARREAFSHVAVAVEKHQRFCYAVFAFHFYNVVSATRNVLVALFEQAVRERFKVVGQPFLFISRVFFFVVVSEHARPRNVKTLHKFRKLFCLLQVVRRTRKRENRIHVVPRKNYKVGLCVRNRLFYGLEGQFVLFCAENSRADVRVGKLQNPEIALADVENGISVLVFRQVSRFCNICVLLKFRSHIMQVPSKALLFRPLRRRSDPRRSCVFR